LKNNARQRLFSTPWDRTRESAAKALGKIGDPRAIEPLIKALDDSCSFARGEAALALVKIGKPGVMPLVKALNQWSPAISMASAEILGKIGDPRAIEPLIQRLSDWNPGLRWKAAIALGEINDAQAIQPLINTLSDWHPKVRQAAADSLKKLGYSPAQVEELINNTTIRPKRLRDYLYPIFRITMQYIGYVILLLIILSVYILKRIYQKRGEVQEQTGALKQKEPFLKPPKRLARLLRKLDTLMYDLVKGHAVHHFFKGLGYHFKGIRFGFRHIELLKLLMLPYGVAALLWFISLFLSFFAVLMIDTPDFKWTQVPGYIPLVILFVGSFFPGILVNITAAPIHDQIPKKYKAIKHHGPEPDDPKRTFGEKLKQIREEFKTSLFFIGVPFLFLLIPIVGVFLVFMASAMLVAAVRRSPEISLRSATADEASRETSSTIGAMVSARAP